MTTYPRLPLNKTTHKEKISGTIDHAVGDKLREIMPNYYYNYSATVNTVLIEGLRALGYEIEV